VAIAIVAIAADRLRGRAAGATALAALALSAAVFWPGVVDQLDLDARPVNAIAAAGVALALGLTVAAVVAGGMRAAPRAPGDAVRLVVAAAVVFVAIPYITNDFGVFVDRIPVLASIFESRRPWAPFGQADLRPGVHLGHHHGFDGALLALAALALSRALGRMRRRRVEAVLALYLAVMLAYGLANEFQDAWNEQLVKTGVVSWSVPPLLVPAAKPAFLAAIGAGLVLYLLVFRRLPRLRDRIGPARRRPALAALALVPTAATAVFLGLALTADGRTVRSPGPTPAERARLSHSGVLAFPVVEHAYDVFAARPDGSGQRDLTASDDKRDLRPTWSPDGRRLAFQSGCDGNPEIYVMDADGTHVRRLTRDRARDGEPSWRRGRIAFVSGRDGNPELYVMRPDGTRQRRLTRNGADDEWPAWSPDGRRLVFQSDRDGDFDLYVMRATGGGLSRLTNLPGDERLPAWSPDGSKIAFESNRDGNYDLYVVGADGRGLRRLTRDAAEDFAPAWSPNGRWLAFASDRDGRDQIFVMRADGTHVLRITSAQKDKDAPAWGR
jgi:Tol biopolymer transport system component